MTITEDFFNHVKSSTLFYDSVTVIGGIRDDVPSFAAATKFMSIRRVGGSQSDIDYGEPVYQIMCGGKNSSMGLYESRLDDLVNYLNLNYSSGIIANVFMSGDIAGPMFLSNDRCYFMITVQLNIGKTPIPFAGEEALSLDGAINIEWPIL